MEDLSKLHAKLLEKLHYDPESGKFTRKQIVQGSRRKPGDEVGLLHWKGYIKIPFDGKQYWAHRLAWFYVHREWPPNFIDHINEVKTDNRICNLRPCTDLENKSFYWSTRKRKKDKFRAQISVGGKTVHVGYFDTKEDAQLARKLAIKSKNNSSL